jgi:hypothetical protein
LAAAVTVAVAPLPPEAGVTVSHGEFGCAIHGRLDVTVTVVDDPLYVGVQSVCDSATVAAAGAACETE